jgi:very-short-patch-repair endonuclease
MGDVVDVVARLGGVARRRDLERAAGRRQLDAAVAAGRLVRAARGRYALPTAGAARRAAYELTGTAVLLSAAAHWGWPVKQPPERPQVAVPPGRKVPLGARQRYDVRWRAVPSAQIADGWVTSRVRTVHDCCVLLPFDEALCVVDSALRDRELRRPDLLVLDDVPPLRRQRVRRVVEAGSDLAHGPFESIVRAIALGVSGLHVRPQVHIDDADGFVGVVDLADVRLRIVIEADSHEFHGGAADFARDCERYSRLTADGWLVIRVPWKQAMFRQAEVRALLERAVALRSRCLGCAVA